MNEKVTKKGFSRLSAIKEKLNNLKVFWKEKETKEEKKSEWKANLPLLNNLFNLAFPESKELAKLKAKQNIIIDTVASLIEFGLKVVY